MHASQLGSDLNALKEQPRLNRFSENCQYITEDMAGAWVFGIPESAVDGQRRERMRACLEAMGFDRRPTDGRIYFPPSVACW